MSTTSINDQLTRAEAELARARARAEHHQAADPVIAAEREVSELRARRERIAAGLAARPAAEKVAAPLLKRAQGDIDASRAAVTAAIVAAEDAIGALHAAVTKHNGLVARTAEQLRGAGLEAYTEHGEYPNGAGKAGHVRLAGRWHGSLPADALIMVAAHRMAVHLYGQYSDLARRLSRYRDVPELENRTDSPLRSLPARPAYVDPAEAAARAEAEKARQGWRGDLAEVFKPSKHAVEMAARDKAKTDMEHRAYLTRALADYGRTRAEIVASKGEAYVRALEAENFVDGKPFGRTWTGGTHS